MKAPCLAAPLVDKRQSKRRLPIRRLGGKNASGDQGGGDLCLPAERGRLPGQQRAPMFGDALHQCLERWGERAGEIVDENI